MRDEFYYTHMYILTGQAGQKKIHLVLTLWEPWVLTHGTKMHLFTL